MINFLSFISCMKLNDNILMFSVNDMFFTHCSFIINNMNEVFGVFNDIIFKYSGNNLTIIKNRLYNFYDKQLFLNMFRRITNFSYRFYIIDDIKKLQNIKSLKELDNFIQKLLKINF
jgi:hypothetical protein